MTEGEPTIYVGRDMFGESSSPWPRGSAVQLARDSPRQPPWQGAAPVFCRINRHCMSARNRDCLKLSKMRCDNELCRFYESRFIAMPEQKTADTMRIAIIGGGPGGLFTAWHLANKAGAAFDITIYEASDRLGGKIVTSSFAGVGLYEAGVAEIYDYSLIGPDPLRDLIENELGLEINPMNGRACVLGGHVIANAEALGNVFPSATRQAVKAFQDKCKSLISRAAYYKSSPVTDNRHPWSGIAANVVLEAEVADPAARDYLRIMSHSDISAPLHHTDGLNLAKNVLMDVPGYIDVYSVVGGNEEIARRLAEEIDADVVTNARLRSMAAQPGGGFALTFGFAAEQFMAQADIVILALPMSALSLMDYGTPSLASVMTRHVAAFDRPGHYLRATVLFDEPFWRAHVAGTWWMSDAFGGTCVYDEGGRHHLGTWGVLGFLIAGNAAIEYANLTDEQIVDLCVASLPSVLGDARSHFVEGRVRRWLGSVNALPGGRPARSLSRNQQPAAEAHPGLFVVGDYLHDSTLNGVLDSADAATDMVVSQFMPYDLGLRSPSAQPADAPGFLDAGVLAGLADSIWNTGDAPRILHMGSGSGEMVAALRALGVEAYGAEPDAGRHARSHADVAPYNINADLARVPFADGHFDVIFETCLCRVRNSEAAAVAAEMARLARHGLVLGSATTDLPLELIQQYRLFDGHAYVASRAELAEVLFAADFDLTLIDHAALERAWKIIAASQGASAFIDGRESLIYAVFDAPGVASANAVAGIKLNGSATASQQVRQSEPAE